ncbi:MAG: MMPL family transporter [Kineosporiaceae bacterium]
MDRLADLSLRHRRWVFAVWLVITLVAMGSAGKLGERLSFDFSLPGQEGYETEKELIASYGTPAAALAVPVLTMPEGSTVTQRTDDVKAVFDAVRAVPGVRVVDVSGTKDPAFVTEDGRSTFGIVYGPEQSGFEAPVVPQIEQAFTEAAKAKGLSPSLTGYYQLQSSSGEDSEGPSVLLETLVGAGLALVVLLFVFASLLAFLPLLIAAVSVLSTFLIVLLLTLVADVSFVVQFLISLVGLGVAIDYSLLVVSRWREERAQGADNDTAVRTAVRTAGHAVIASGVTVAISLLALVVVPVPLLRSMGFGGMLIPLVSVAVVLTLLPAFLKAVGPRVDWPRIRHEENASRGWTAWTRLTVRWRWAAFAVAAGLLALLIAPVASIQFGVSGTESQASAGPAVTTLHELREAGVGTGVVTPIVVLYDKGSDAAAAATAIAGVSGVRSATAAPPGTDGRIAVDVVPDGETVNSDSITVVDRVRDAARGVPGFLGATGTGATITDYRKAVYDRFPLVVGVIALITFILLARTFRSLLLPLKAVALNLLSLGAVMGAVTFFWQEGHGSGAIFDVQPTGALTFWIPPLIFAFLFGLSMDYEVFILARMREEYDEVGSTDEAVVRGLARTGRLVTSAALILFFSFAALASAPGTDIKVFATALGVGILIDATIVRALLVPALVSLLGSWNWWLPAWAATVLRVEPSPRRTEPTRSRASLAALGAVPPGPRGPSADVQVADALPPVEAH